MPLDMQYYRSVLEKERQRLLKKREGAEGMGKHESLQDSTQELSLYDNHPADLASEIYERSKDLALHAHELARYKEINAALAKINRGEYGSCENCGQDIDPARLDQIPETPLCLDCRERKEFWVDVSARPLEEDALRQPFGRSFKDKSSYTAYDGEDAWQDVARYNKLPHVHYEDVGEDDETIGYVEDTDKISNEDYRKQLE